MTVSNFSMLSNVNTDTCRCLRYQCGQYTHTVRFDVNRCLMFLIASWSQSHIAQSRV